MQKPWPHFSASPDWAAQTANDSALAVVGDLECGRGRRRLVQAHQRRNHRAKALQRLEAKGRGILLLHGIHPATAMALPTLLKELKAHGFHVVQVVPAGDRLNLCLN